ncbi:TIGR03619 family F420-dependent LLM class oxidoreductase [Pseudonocardia sp. KRD291]|uniref:TIGR03619 family F420-dependent LLM class oxidoreductase n=1 Tax=Pseudonocardia sp. KRD291 TaxID=2792007 RepID=UPI001C4A219F|nr:TIGR03619 family F420-dependent LLM class oxidoreductase [Pseudonocardia sp. KRD291]MBW0102915.1 TIGR03619 family F420-dependent LLM class oxidoreductase [Pseudonocardia sp. KRD291]
MRIGFCVPQFGRAAAHVEDTMRFAAGAEERGAASLWTGDRLLAAVDPRVGYGGGPGIPEEFRAAHDPLALLTAAAAVTTRVTLGTSTLNAPWYPAALLARHALTVDRISGGRLLLGLGTGWSPEEYDAVGVPMRERGARLDECLDVLSAWWHDDPVQVDGTFQTIAPSHVTVKPHGIPVFMAGFAERARRRIAERADGFLPVVVPGTPDLDAAVNAPWQALRDAAGDAGRDPSSIGAALRVNPRAGDSVESIGETLHRVAEQTDVEHAFVDLMYLAGDADAALELVSAVLDAAG